ncbi:MAG: lipoyl(octanoyl) transferase [Gammaproteobacteria bacterium]
MGPQDLTPADQDPAEPAHLNVRRLGRISYADAHALQTGLLAKRASGELPDQLLICEHEALITIGRSPRSEKRSELEAVLDIPVVEVERGGEATWHGPGQLVAYPIRLLPEGRRDLHAYLRDLESVVIDTLADFGVEARREPGLTGVWVGSQKIASSGIAVRRWVTWHGLALNLTNDIQAFGGFHPCGLDASVMTRLADMVETMPSRLAVEQSLEAHFRNRFGY